jgi:ABC-type lipoprotein release transport system permease subunit
MSGSESIIIGFVGTVLTTLCGAVAVLWSRQVKNEETTRTDLQECRSDRERLWAKVETLQTEIGKLLRGA